MSRVSSFIAATDIHRHKGISNLRNILELIAGDQLQAPLEAVIIGGDSVGGGKPPRMGGDIKEWQPVFSPEEIKEEVREAMGADIPVFLTYGSHDLNAEGGNESFFSGPADMEGYYLYGISFCQMRYDSREQTEESNYQGPDIEDANGSCAQEAAANFLKWNESAPEGLPVFVMSHMPLHANRGDNQGALSWSRAFNEAAGKRPVYVFFGHNHSAERRDPAPEKRFYMVSPGEILPVQGPEREMHVDMPIRFTYLNAGYILNGAATLITIEDGRVTLKRYEL